MDKATAKKRVERLTMALVDEEDNLTQQILQIARRLEGIAAEVERIAHATADGEYNNPIDKVRRVQHEVLWGVANLNLDLLANTLQNIARAERMVTEARIEFARIEGPVEDAE